MIRRSIAAVVVLAASMMFGAGTAQAFVPPANPAGNFSCPDVEGQPNPVAGHPGSDGLMKAMGESGKLTAWSAVFDPRTGEPKNGPVTLCGE
jgi:hypothetical protein